MQEISIWMRTNVEDFCGFKYRFYYVTISTIETKINRENLLDNNRNLDKNTYDKKIFFIFLFGLYCLNKDIKFILLSTIVNPMLKIVSSTYILKN